jgi:hypothetical protein
MRRNLFWGSDEQWRRIEPHLPTDVRCVERADDRRVISGIVREIMAKQTTWTGTASDFLRMCAEVLGQAMPGQTDLSVRWPKNPRALAGRLRRAQTFLRALGIEISFSRDGRAGTRLIGMTARNPVNQGSTSRCSQPRPALRRGVERTANDKNTAKRQTII